MKRLMSPDSERCYAKGEWLMRPTGDGGAEYLQRYWRPEHAVRAARDFNETGRALAPVEYASPRLPRSSRNRPL
jgi:hypothetical protein